MRHRYKKLKTLKTWVVKRDLVIRNLITSLIKHGQIKTTPKKAKILKSEIDKIFNKIVRFKNRYDDDVFKKEIARLVDIILTNDVLARDKFIKEIVPMILWSGKQTGFVNDYKFNNRKWDNVMEVIVSLDISSKWWNAEWLTW